MMGLRFSLCFLLFAVACGDPSRAGHDAGSVAREDGGGSSPPDASPAADGSGSGADAGTADPVGDGTVGSACVTDADCTDPPEAECWTSIGTTPAPNGYCSLGCTHRNTETGEEPTDCGSGAGCSSFSGSGGGGGTSLSFCSRNCTDDADCRPEDGYTCHIVFLGMGYCAPPGL